jgi:hypothetical protein
MNTDYYKTHNIFFERIHSNTLNELYRRATLGILKRDIHSRLKKGFTVSVKKTPNCHIYINFIKGNIQIGHISLHIEPENKSFHRTARKRGRFHAINNIYTQRSYTFKLNKASNIFISYNTTQNIDNDFKYILDIVIGVLNEYIQPNNILSLNNYNNTYKDICTPNMGGKRRTRRRL